jgi:hypothetical protein
MSHTIPQPTPFSKIDWSTLQNRPSLTKDMPICTDKQWDKRDARCCMSGYAIEHVRDIAFDAGKTSSPESAYINGYPCVNGVELDNLFDAIMNSSQVLPEASQDLSRSIFERISQGVIALFR